MTQILTVSLITLLLEHLVRLKLRRKPDEEPEAIQGKPVDRVLYHLVTDAQCPWDAGESWEKHGRGHIVALERQGLDDLLDERAVEDYKAAYTLGYCVREQEDAKKLEALRKRLERREEALQRKQWEVDGLREKLAQRPTTATEPQRNTNPAPVDPLQEGWHEWGTCGDSLETIMQRKGWQRIAAPEPVHVAEEPEDSTQTAESVTEDTASIYADMTTEERTATMIKLKDEGKSYREIALLFGVTEGSAKGAISRGRKAKNNVVHLFGECSEGVRAVP